MMDPGLATSPACGLAAAFASVGSGFEGVGRVVVAATDGGLIDAPGSLAMLLGLALVAGVVAGMALARRKARREMEEILRRADGQVWRAIVVREGTEYRWSLHLYPSALFAGLFDDGSGSDIHHPWEHIVAPRRQEMDARSRAALESGAPGYSQEFPIERRGVTRWLQEHVTIRALGAGRWSLTGVITDVTALRAEEQRLRERDRMVIQTLARADCLLWRASVQVTDGVVKWLRFDMPTSALYRRLFGDRTEAAGGRLWSLLEVPDLPAMNARSSHAILSGSTGYEQEFCALRDNEMFWLHEQVSIAPVGPGEFQLVGVIMDVTARRAAVEARKATEAQIEQLLEHADCLLWQARVFRLAPAASDPGGGELRWVLFVPRSSLHRELFGRDPDDPPRLAWREIVPEAVCVRMQETAHGAILSEQAGYEQEIPAAREGRDFWLRERVTIQRISEREWYLVGVIFDVSDLRRAEAELAAEKERLAVTLAAMADAVITTDRDGVVLFANRAAGELLRFDPDAVVGRPVEAVCRFVTDRGGPVAGPVAEVVRVDAPVAIPAHTRIAINDVILGAVEGAGAPVHDPTGAIVGVVVVLRDVTERERLEQEISRASKLQSVGLLAGGIAHDFNNLLTVIMGNVVVARQSLPPEGDAPACLLDAERAVMRAKDLTQQLLTFARGGDPVRAAVSLPGIISEAAAFGAHGSSVRCQFDLPDDLWLADADRGQIAQVVQNLVINAVQAMPGGGIVRIAACNETVSGGAGPVTDGAYVCITVVDAGCGISAEDLPRIFDPYFTTKSQGSGLGLATVYSIIRKHRGWIGVESTPGAGTTFRIYLPASVATVEATVPGSPPGRAPGRLRGRVLFMDDEEAIRKIGGRMLSRLGLSVETAADGAEALERYRAAREVGRPFDVVMLDLTVPGGMGGREAFERMRAIDPDVRGVVSSGYSSDPVLSDFRAHGFVGMIPKPYRIDDCARVLGEVLATARPQA